MRTILAFGLFILLPGCEPAASWQATVATLEVVRPVVEATGPAAGGRHPVESRERLSAGAEVSVGERARALLRHDRGARLLLDGGAAGVLTEEGLRLRAGRAWVDVRAGSQVALEVGEALLSAGGSGAGFEVGINPAALTVVRGEVAWRMAGKADRDHDLRGLVHAGEALRLDGPPKTAPVALWDDWTGGLAWPDSRRGGATGMGEVGARRPGDLGEARFPLSIQRLQVRTRIEDDLAVTTVEQTFFNPAESTLEGIYRVRVPEGAILSRFAIDRHGRYVDGYVKERELARRDYQEKVYEGSTHDPALLEWEAPGSYRARLYPLPPGATRRVLLTYSEWLAPHGPRGSLRSFRYPMAGAAGPGASLIQELDIEVDATRAGGSEVRAGLGAFVPRGERRVLLRRTDYLPTADLTVELRGEGRDAGTARAYRAPHQLPDRGFTGGGRRRSEDDYVLLRALPVPARPADKRQPVDLALVLDLSAATDATHLAMARTLVESVLRHLNPEDRVTLLGADLDLHAIGREGERGGGKNKRKLPPLQPAGAEQVQRLLQALSEAATGGATDLGADLGQAAALLAPDRLGAVLYVGDAQPTVGELDLPALRERLERLPAPPRLYGVGIGAEADLGLLQGLCQASAGQAYRVSDRAAAAETALQLLSHLSRPAATRVVVDAGPGVDRVYPRQPVSVLAGEPLTVVARLRKGMPASLNVEGLLLGQAFRKSFPVEVEKIEDTADLRLRWSQARLEQLLQGGASTEEVAELGVRQNLITPFTSFYVPSEEEIGRYLRQVPEVRAAGCSGKALAPMMARSRDEAAPVAAAAPASPPPAEEAENRPMPSGRVQHERKESAKKARAAAEPAAEMERTLALKDVAGAGGGSVGALALAQPAAAPKKPRSVATEGGDARDKSDAFADGHMNAAPAEPRALRGGGYLDGDGRKGGKAAHGKAKRRKARADDSEDPLMGLGLAGAEDADADVDVDVNKERQGPVTTRLASREGITIVIGILTHRPRGCSAAAGQPLDERVDLWRERLAQRGGVRRALEVFQDAQQGCELPRWTDRREILRLMLRSVGAPAAMVQLYRHFADQPEEQDFLRLAILGEVRTPADLRVVYDGLGLGDAEKTTLVQEVVRGARGLPERLRRIQDLLGRWPGNLWLKLARMEAEELLGMKEAARRSAENVRQDPYADAQARTAVGELYLRLGEEQAARRAFSEIVEFAPRDPLARRRLGDLYRAHGWFDEAARQYQTLGALLPGDLAVLILQSLAAFGAGHVEESLGLLARVAATAEPGSETGLPRVALQFSALRQLVLRDEARKKGDAEEQALLLARAKNSGVLGLARPVRVFLLYAHPEADLELHVAAPGEALGSATELAPEFGLLGWHGDRPDGRHQIEVRRGDGSPAALVDEAELVVVTGEGGKGERLYRVPLHLSTGEPVLRFALHDNRLDKEEVR